MNPKPKPHPKGYKFPLFKPAEGLSDEVIDALFRQSILPHYPGEHYLAGVRRYTRLVEAELQGMVRPSSPTGALPLR